MSADKTIWECPVYTLSSQLDGSQRLVIQAASAALQDNGVPLSLLAEWLFANFQIGLFSGTANPLTATGNNGDLYLQNGTLIKQKIAGSWVLKWTLSVPPVPEDIAVTTSTANPLTILLSDHPTFDKNADFLYWVSNVGFKDFTVTRTFSGSTFTGWTFFGHDDGAGHFLEAATITIKP